MKKNWERLMLIYGPFKGPFLITILLTTLQQVCALGVPYIVGKITDGFVERKGNETLQHLYFWVLVAIGIKIFDSFLEYYRGVVHVRDIAYKLDQHISNITILRITKLSIGQITNQNSGFKHEVVKQGAVAFGGMFDLFFHQMLSPMLRIVIMVIAIGCINVWFGLLCGVGVVAYFTAATQINKGLMSTFRGLKEIESKIETEFWEIIKNLKLVNLNNKGEEMARKQAGDYEYHEQAGAPVWIRYFQICQLYRDPFLVIAQYGLIFLALYFVDIKVETPGDAIIAIGWSISCFGSITNVGSMQRSVVKLWVNMVRYFTLIEVEPVVKNSDKPIYAPVTGKIQFRNVYFKYPYGTYNTLDLSSKGDVVQQPSVLENVSCVINAGETVAFVGHSGAGKSTAIQLLLRGYDPDSGEILIDGHDLRDFDLGHIRRAIGYVEQHIALWDGTLRRNLLDGLKDEDRIPSDEELLEVAHKAGIDKFFHRLGDNPLDAVIGENGILLSGGERQRIAIARAMIKDPRILIFDEATNALDNVNEAAIQAAIREALKERTGIIIAHRLSTVRNADKIIVFEKGRIVGIGKHEELLNTCGHYRELVERELAGGESLQAA